MKIAILGSGAIGSYYGTRLALGGHEVHFLVRRDPETLRRSGIRLQFGEKEDYLPDPKCHTSVREIGPCDMVIISLKSTQNNVLPDLVPPLLKDDTMLLTLQNGLGSDSFLAKHFPRHRVFGGLCFIGLNRISPGLVKRFSRERLSFGEHGCPSGLRVEKLTEMFRACGVEALTAPSLLEAQWRKLVWNIPFNGLGIAAGGVGTQTILADDELNRLVRPLMEEVCRGAAAYGVDIEEGFIEDQVGMTYPMGEYRPSSVVDFIEGREVEVEPLWGEPVRRARSKDADVPRMAMLYALIRKMTAGRGVT